MPCKIEEKPFIFISYARSDAHVVSPVLEGIAASGYSVWYDHGIEINTMWTDEIANAIIASAIVVVFVTKGAMASGYVRMEVEFAISKGVRVIPIYLEGIAVLPPGLALMLQSTQGIESSDANVIVFKLCKWLSQNVKQESWQPAKSSMAAEPAMPVAPTPLRNYLEPLQEDSFTSQRR